MKLKNHFLFYLPLLIIIPFSSCKKDKQCNDPNYGIPSSDFTMRQTLRPFGLVDNPNEIAEFSDTIVSSSPGVLFSAIEDNVIRYEWTIGDDKRLFNTKEVALDFSQFLNNPDSRWKPIPIQLKVVKVPKPPHNPADSVYITTKNLVFADIFLWNGTFEGYFEHEPKIKRTISFDFTKLHTYQVSDHAVIPCKPCFVEGYHLYNLAPNFNDTFKIQHNHVFENGDPKLVSYKQLKWKSDETDKRAWPAFHELSSGITYFHSFANYNDKNKIQVRLEYRHQKERNGVETTYVFHGIKID